MNRLAARPLICAVAMVLAAAGQAQDGYAKMAIGTSGCSVLVPGAAEGLTVESWSGTCRDALADGRGTLRGRWADAQGAFTFEGAYARGMRQGYGRARYENGLDTAGNYRDGRLHGWVSVRTGNGASFEGQFADDVRHGIGTIIAANGQVTRGRWVKGQLAGVQQWQSGNGAAWAAIDVPPGSRGTGIVNANGAVLAGGIRLADGGYQLDGIAIDWYEQQLIFFGNFAGGRPDGPGAYIKPDAQNTGDAAVYGGSYNDGCLWRGDYFTKLNKAAGACTR